MSSELCLPELIQYRCDNGLPRHTVNDGRDVCWLGSPFAHVQTLWMGPRSSLLKHKRSQRVDRELFAE
jgi:hypothetical protein